MSSPTVLLCCVLLEGRCATAALLLPVGSGFVSEWKGSSEVTVQQFAMQQIALQLVCWLVFYHKFW